jgi:hypothetical protein
LLSSERDAKDCDEWYCNLEFDTIIDWCWVVATTH